jgi:hypothetical protein
MQRTAEEFVHELPNGRWFVGDFVRTAAGGREIYLVELYPGHGGLEVAIADIAAGTSSVRTYAHKASAKRAAQRMIERVLDEDRRGAR